MPVHDLKLNLGIGVVGVIGPVALGFSPVPQTSYIVGVASIVTLFFRIHRALSRVQRMGTAVELAFTFVTAGTVFLALAGLGPAYLRYNGVDAVAMSTDQHVTWISWDNIKPGPCTAVLADSRRYRLDSCPHADFGIVMPDTGGYPIVYDPSEGFIARIGTRASQSLDFEYTAAAGLVVMAGITVFGLRREARSQEELRRLGIVGADS
jgi:hypothetical protein